MDGLLERTGELAAITDAARRAAAGVGQLVVVEAHGGLGKSALLASAALDGLVLTARGIEVEREFAYGVVRQLFERYVAEHVPDELLTGPARGVLDLFGTHRPAGEPPTDLSPFPMMHALYWLVANLAAAGPLALVVDDAHEADRASLRFLAYLARRRADLPLLLLVATRPDVTATDHPGGELARADVDVALHPAPLSSGAVHDLADRWLGRPADQHFVDACVRATGGNPFYLRELIRDALSRGATSLPAGGPRAVRESVQRRIRAAPEGALRLLRAGAVLGDGARLLDAAVLAELTLPAAAAIADALTGVAILDRGRALTFRHPILRASVLEAVPPHELALLHQRAAALLRRRGAEPQAVAAHLLRAEPAGETDVVHVLREAAGTAARQGSPALAVDYLRRALEEFPELADGDLLFELGRSEAALGDRAGLDHMARGVEVTADPALRATRAARLADFALRDGRAVDAVAQLRLALDELAGADPELILGLRTAAYWAGRLHPQTAAAALRLRDELKGEVDGPDVPARRQLLVYLAAEAAHGESLAAARALLDRAFAPPGLFAHTPVDSIPAYVALLTLVETEQYERFDAVADEALIAVGERGALLAFLVLATFRALVLLRRGDLAGAQAEAEAAVESASVQGWRAGAGGLLALRAIALAEEGRTGEAARVLDETATIDVPPGFPSALLGYARGALALALGEARAARDELLRCGAILSSMGLTGSGLVPWRTQAALASFAAGDVDEARRLASDDLDLVRRLGTSIALGRGLRVAARFADDPIATLRRSLAELDATPARLDRAETLVDLGAALRRAGQPSAAREHLAQGLDLATSCAADVLAARAREELLAAGGRPRRARRFGPEALTPSEARVTRLAANGMTNTAIAQSLFVTPKTVEKHLASAYRKLGITSRAELERVLLHE